MYDRFTRDAGATIRWYRRRAEGYRVSGRLEEALAEWRRAAADYPASVDARVQIGRMLIELGRTDDAIEAFHVALEIQPESSLVRYLLARTELARGRLSGAELVELAREGFAHNPEDHELGAALAWELATCPDDTVRDGTEALEIAKRLCPPAHCADPVHLDILAAAYAETGDFPAAVRCADRAYEIVTDPARIATMPPEVRQRVIGIARRLDLYRAGRPYRTPSAAD